MERYLRPGAAGEGRRKTKRNQACSDPRRVWQSEIGLINIPPLKSRRRELRNNPTAEEATLWKHLQRRQVLGKKFRRQYSIGRYIVDFFCVECDIAVELDGAPHFRELGEEYDGERTLFLQGLGIEILRFKNRVVRENIEAVLETIRETVRTRIESDHSRGADVLRQR